MKPRRGRPIKIEVVTVEPQRRFDTVGRLPLARLRFERELSDGIDAKTRLTYRIRASGPLGPVYARIFGMKRNALEVVANTARLAAVEG